MGVGPCLGVLACLLCYHCVLSAPAQLVPTIIPRDKISYRDTKEEGHFYRSIMVEGNTAYIGARNYVFKIDLDDESVQIQGSRAGEISLERTSLGMGSFAYPSFDPPSQHASEFPALKARMVQEEQQLQLEATERLAEIYKLPNTTLFRQCERQLNGLRMYYGDSLILPLYNASVLCVPHARALTGLPPSASRAVFALKTGIFGTLALAPTGLNDYTRGFQAWHNLVGGDTSPYPFVTSPQQTADPGFVREYGDLENPQGTERTDIWERQFDMGNRCHRCQDAASYDDPRCLRSTASRLDPDYDSFSRYMRLSGPLVYCFKPRESINNLVGVYSRCDYQAAPNRLLLTEDLALTDSRLPPTARETCKGGLLSSTMFAGFHPDQTTITLYSGDGSGGGDSPSASGPAMYVLTEIGQEKQWDINHEMFMGYEDPTPTASSQSLALVRLPIRADGEVDQSRRIVLSNPFNHLWVTSPATKFGRLVKTHNQAAVGVAPRAVALAEDESFVYVFFREVDWESLSLPAYNTSRYNFNWRAYDRALSFPFEEDRLDEPGSHGRLAFQPEEFALDNYTFSSFLSARVEGTQPEDFERIRREAEEWWEAYDQFYRDGANQFQAYVYKGRSFRPSQFSEELSGKYNTAGRTDAYPLHGYTRQHVYAPTLEGYDQLWKQQQVTGRVARVCKNDVGLPMGTVDGSYFNLDNHLSLSAFQSFIKTRLRCAVPMPAVSRVWRLRKDYANFWYNGFLNNRQDWHGPDRTVDWYEQNFPKCTVKLAGDKWYGNRSMTWCWPTYGLQNTIFAAPPTGGTQTDASLRQAAESDTAAGCAVRGDLTIHYDTFDGPFCDFMRQGRNVAFRQLLRDYGNSGSFFFKESMYKNHLSGYNQYFWHYIAPKLYTSTSYYFSELRDIKKVGDTYYGTFTSNQADEIERLRDAGSGEGKRFDLPAHSSAICSFTADQLQEAFSGPFKGRRDGHYRPVNPAAEGVTPSPYECTPDPATDAAYALPKMNLKGMADDSFPMEDEMEDFDVRRNSTRAAFLDGEDTGTRTMWRDVDATPVMMFSSAATSSSSAVGPLERLEHTRVTSDREYDVLYAATTKGDLYKVVTWTEASPESCYSTDGDSLMAWWRDQTNLKDNEWDDYFEMTQEKDTNLPGDLLFRSTWAKCVGGQRSRHKVLAKIKPFDEPTRVWSLKLAGDVLLLGTDERVVRLDSSLCSSYMTCYTCAVDPHCGWNSANNTCLRHTAITSSSLIQNVTGAPQCGATACPLKTIQADLANNVMLDVGVLAPERDFSWYVNSSALEERELRYMYLRNSSLLILGVSRQDIASEFELRDRDSGQCMGKYRLLGGDCEDQDLGCLYQAKYREWCDQYDNWYYQMVGWQEDMKELGCTTA